MKQKLIIFLLLFLSINSELLFFNNVFATGEEYIVYSNLSNGGKLYKKSANDTSSGIPITNINSTSPTFSPDGNFIVYSNLDDGGKLYKKSSNDTDNGIPITDVYSSIPTFSPDGNFIVYSNQNDGGKLYKKGSNNIDNGTPITSVDSNFPTFSPEGNYIIYSNQNDGGKLYKKGSNNIDNGTPITDINGAFPTFSPDGNYIVYTNYDDFGNLYKKNANDTSNGFSITTGNWFMLFPTFSPDGNYIVYYNWIEGGMLYKKGVNDTDNGTPITSVDSKYPKYFSFVISVNNAKIIKLTQEIQSPEIDKQEVKLSEKIGKFQSGSGIILSANINNDSQSKIKLDFEVYKLGGTMPVYVDSTDYFISGTGTIIVPFQGEGDYFWKVRIKYENGKYSDWVNYENDYAWEYDFSRFEGFEPYPYGYSFVNSSPDYKELNGGVNYYTDSEFPFFHMDYVPGNKWDMFNTIFNTSSGFEIGSLKSLRAFESIGLNNDTPSVFNGNCFGLALSALTQKYFPEKIQKSFLEFSNNIGTGYIRNKIKVNIDDITKQWLGFDNNIKTILSYQLYQYDKYFSEKLSWSQDNETPIDILNKIKDNSDKTYLIGFNGKVGCNILGFGCTEYGHAVIAYKVEGNRIYIWDNAVPYPVLKKDEGIQKAYERYIEINTEENSFIIDGYNWNFTRFGAVAMDEIYTNTSSPIGFNNNDTLYTLSGNSDILIIDKNGNKTGYDRGEFYENIPGVKIFTPLNLGENTKNTWKQIYIPQKIEGLTIKVSGKTDENYNLMIAGGDYYTKVSGINTSSGQIDSYNSTGTGLSIDFDDNKTGTGKYDILFDNFQNNLTGTIYIPQIEEQKGLQTISINWYNVVNNTDNAVVYQADIDNDGIIDISKNTKAIENPQDITKKKSSISGKINILQDNKSSKKDEKEKYNDIILMFNERKENKDEKEDDKHKDKYTKRQLIKIAKDGNFRLDNIKPGNYKLEIVNNEKKNKVLTPEIGYYELEIKNGFDYINKDFDIIKNYKEHKEEKDKSTNLNHK